MSCSPRRNCLRVASKSHVAMVLGEHVYDRGARANRIGRCSPLKAGSDARQGTYGNARARWQPLHRSLGCAYCWFWKSTALCPSAFEQLEYGRAATGTGRLPRQ